ncbi:hypothetical protein [Phyllobacterium sp. SB3]|uniref:hypothetical protein n=1 Tax=Phyllobacterium sp. SB3 TaxID=3156073 RepID=UPI0032AFBF63
MIRKSGDLPDPVTKPEHGVCSGAVAMNAVTFEKVLPLAGRWVIGVLVHTSFSPVRGSVAIASP